jgi:predicted glycosyltransferase
MGPAGSKGGTPSAVRGGTDTRGRWTAQVEICTETGTALDDPHPSPPAQARAEAISANHTSVARLLAAGLLDGGPCGDGMTRALVYSHDTFGLGNVRRMLAVSEALLARDPNLSVLLVTGSPVAHSFRLPPRLDYIKLPCLTRVESERYEVKFLKTELDETIGLRSSMLLNAASRFKPDLVLVDKKPSGIRDELGAALQYLRRHLPRTRNVLVLRDILDSPEVTRRTWERGCYHALINEFYDQILVLGAREVFDAPREYHFPAGSTDKVRYCGYVPRSPGVMSRDEVRRALRLPDQDQLVLVTAGGGADGFRLLDTYLSGVARRGSAGKHSLVVAGPELPDAQRMQLARAAAQLPGVTLVEFLDDMMSYIGAADMVVSMGGYNTVCEILSARKRAVVVPRVRPVAEQGMRAERMARLGLFETIHPDELSPEGLFDAVERQLRAAQAGSAEYAGPDLVGLFESGDWAATLLRDVAWSREQPRPAVSRVVRLAGRPTRVNELAVAQA